MYSHNLHLELQSPESVKKLSFGLVSGNEIQLLNTTRAGVLFNAVITMDGKKDIDG